MMRELFREQIETILREVAGSGGPFAGGRGAADDAVRLQHWLYQECFCKRCGGAPEPRSQSSSLLPALSSANSGRDRWDSGWEITHVNAAGRVTARRYDAIRSFWPGEFLTVEGPELPPARGMHLKAFFPKESATMQTGYYFAFGNAPEEDFDPPSIVRFYWAVRSSGAVLLVGSLTASLNRLEVPFRFKTGIDAQVYGRLDSAVLYVQKRFYQITARLLAPVYREVCAHLVPGTPLFTKPLAPGLGLAEDPGNGESFGIERCRLLANAMLSAWPAIPEPVPPPVDAVVGELERAGVRADAPYLSPGSVDQYYFTLEDGTA